MIPFPLRLLLAALTAAAFISSPAAAQSTSGQDLTPDGRGSFVSVAGAVDAFVLQSGERAVEKARRPEVRQLAETMITAHRQSLDGLLATARERGLDANQPGMLPFQWARLRSLDRASASRFDRIYLNQQIEAHEIALELHRNFAANGNDDALRALAQAAIPIEQQHLDQARSLQ